MHIFFSGIGGAGIGPLALVAKQAGYTVSGSDKQDSQYITYLRDHGITDIHIGQTEEAIAAVHEKNTIDWFVYSSAVEKENPDSPELQFVQKHDIHATKRDEFLNKILKDKNLKLIAIAGTHGKTTTTAMTIWLLQQLDVPVSYILPAKTNFAEMGHYQTGSEYFVYEADEYDRNFLAFRPHMSIITGVDWDHPDIYPTRQEYYQAFRDFVNQSQDAFIWSDDAAKLGFDKSTMHLRIIAKQDYHGFNQTGAVNRQNAAIAAQAVMQILEHKNFQTLTDIMNQFPGVSRRFEPVAKNIYTDYAHTPEKIRGALQLSREVVAGTNRRLVVVYEGLHNTRQHFIKTELAHLFDDVDELFVVPSYRAREDESLEDLTPEKLIKLLSKPELAKPAALNNDLKNAIAERAAAGDLVLCLSAGGGASLDEWIRQNFSQ